MKKLLLVVIVAALGWFFYVSRDDLRSRASKDDYVMKEYKKSMDKAREVEDKLQQAKDRLDGARP
jgi:Tfp pilus assembly protein PilO